MTKLLDDTMIRELSADELLVVSGAKPAEPKEPVIVDILGWQFQRNQNSGAVAWWGVSLPGRPSQLIYAGH